MAVVLNLLSSGINGTGGRKRIVKRYSVTLSGSYSGSGTTGEVFNAQTGPTNSLKIERAGWARNPDQYAVPNQPVGYVMRIQPASVFAGWGLRFFEAGADGGDLDEIADGAYPSPLTADTSLTIELSAPAL